MPCFVGSTAAFTPVDKTGVIPRCRMVGLREAWL